MPLASWLFLREGESIWVERPYGYSVVVAGPGPSRTQRDFESEAALDAYQMQLAEQLASAGWFLWGVDRDRRQGERRGTPRRSDRRQPTAAPR